MNLEGKQPMEMIRWQLAKEFGWTLEYIDSLSVADWHEYAQIQDGLVHVRKSIIKPK
jgi:hypothetical protein